MQTLAQTKGSARIPKVIDATVSFVHASRIQPNYDGFAYLQSRWTEQLRPFVPANRTSAAIRFVAALGTAS